MTLQSREGTGSKAWISLRQSIVSATLTPNTMNSYCYTHFSYLEGLADFTILNYIGLLEHFHMLGRNAV